MVAMTLSLSITIFKRYGIWHLSKDSLNQPHNFKEIAVLGEISPQ